MSRPRAIFLLAIALLVLGFVAPAPFAAGQTVLVEGGKESRKNAICRTQVRVPAEHARQLAVILTDDEGSQIVGQLGGRLFSELPPANEGDPSIRELTFIADLPAGETRKLQIEWDRSPPAESRDQIFSWKEEGDKYSELSFAGRPVMRYMCEPLDTSSPERRGETFKPYHHVYDPQGKRYVTKGPGGLFPHHRGLFYGFNRIQHGGQQADTWHCNRGESQQHVKTIYSQAGPVYGSHAVEITWHGRDGKPFATEFREMTAYNTPDGTLIEFVSRLMTNGETIKLDGDPQHAGFQFRAAQDVPDKTAKLTYYLRPDGKGEPGKFRNWPERKDHVDLAWNALSFVIDDARYTCCYLDRPQNPKEARFSERDYGRFGSYFEYELEFGKAPLDLNYRVWLQEGEMTVEEAAALSRDFVEPAKVTVQ